MRDAFGDGCLCDARIGPLQRERKKLRTMPVGKGQWASASISLTIRLGLGVVGR